MLHDEATIHQGVFELKLFFTVKLSHNKFQFDKICGFVLGESQFKAIFIKAYEVHVYAYAVSLSG